ncbi:MAG: VanW family protein [Candidatus Sericytochromatia bacterium]|nr:VanW family protein [Candidatus Tanganyikabacteria bacterium]
MHHRKRFILPAVATLMLAVAVVLYLRDPFRDTLGAYSTDLAPRTAEQRRNIGEGARRLDRVEIEPGGAFSFNRAVGPRTLARGFVPATAFLEGARTESSGGGICQVSSTLYNAALAAGMTIEARVPHDRLVESVPAGADATVWYGKADLAFRNGLGGPVRILARADGDRLTIAIRGVRQGPAPAIVRQELPPPRPGTVQMLTWRVTGARRELISQDVYRR